MERLSLEADPAWHGMQKLNLRLSGLPASGVLQLEVMRGGYMSGPKVLTLPACCCRAASGRELSGSVVYRLLPCGGHVRLLICMHVCVCLHTLV